VPPDLPSSVDPRSEEATALYGSVPFISRTFPINVLPVPPGDVDRMHTVLNAFFQTPICGEEKRRLQEHVTGLYSLFSSLLIADPHLTAERAGKKDQAWYLLAVEQMIENDYHVPSYLADAFKKADGWIETDTSGSDWYSVGGSNSLCN
jgi:RNA exonuclease 1